MVCTAESKFQSCFFIVCTFFFRQQYAWVADGVKVSQNKYPATLCRASHLTSFGAGFFHTPNTIDFEFVFANPSFNDNMTIYMTVIVCVSLWILLMVWSTWQDWKDRQKLRSLPMPDNESTNGFLYEILTFTGHWDGSSCDSAVYFELTGDESTTGV